MVASYLGHGGMNILQVLNVRRTSAHRSTLQAYKQQDVIADYLLTPAGEVHWQYEYINRGLNAPNFS